MERDVVAVGGIDRIHVIAWHARCDFEHLLIPPHDIGVRTFRRIDKLNVSAISLPSGENANCSIHQTVAQGIGFHRIHQVNRSEATPLASMVATCRWLWHSHAIGSGVDTSKNQ